MEIRPTKEGRFNRIVEEQDWWFGPVALGNGTQYKIMVVRTNRGVFIGIEGKGCYEFQNFSHPGYVLEKLNLRFEGDAQNLADFINQQFGLDFDIYGRYEPQYCVEGL